MIAAANLIPDTPCPGQADPVRSGCHALRPVRVRTEDGRELPLLGSDPSCSDVRLVGPLSLLGKKVQVVLRDADGSCRDFPVRVLWAFPTSEGLVENGGVVLPAGAWGDATGG